MNDQPENSTPAADPLAKLLSRCAVRPAPPAQLEAEVRAAVHAEWLHLHQMRKSRRQRRWLAAAAVLIVGVGVGWVAHTPGTSTSPAPQPALMIASVTQLQGLATLNDTPVNNHEQIREGDTLRSAAHSGARIELNNGVSVRVASATSVHWLKQGEVRLNSGGIYIDSHARQVALVVHTAQGDVTHLGTRYLIEAQPQRLRIAVREGHAALRTARGELTINPLEQLQVDAHAQLQRSAAPLDDPLWQWADALSEPFALEDRSVAEFLQWVADETGYELVYTNNMVKAAASNTVLHGQRTTRPPLQALQMVLATTDFHAIPQGKQLLIIEQQ